MKLILDTHAMLWWWSDPDRLPPTALSQLSDGANTVLASAVSAYEIAYKHQLGKLSLPTGLLADFENAVADERWTPLPISTAHSLLAGQLASPHRDPFDRLLAAQAILEDAVLVTADPAFSSFSNIKILWSQKIRP